ncbi:MAG: hypothetical protein MPN21_17875 [Thermoanaerobaculia bacterium]|nr:hypothetical protein [Thermoanaerobaculia bacterium]
MVFDPQEPGTGYASRDAPFGGVLKTTDGGASWTNVSTGLITEGVCVNTCILDLVIDPTSPKALYAGAPGHGVFKTIDAGETWVSTNNNHASEMLALVSAHPSTVYSGGSVFAETGLEKTTDGGETWIDLPHQPNLPPPWVTTYHRAFEVDPEDPNSIWWALEDGASDKVKLYHSSNGGLFWSLADEGLEGARVLDFAFRNGSLMAATNDGIFQINTVFADGFESGNLSAWTVP